MQTNAPPVIDPEADAIVKDGQLSSSHNVHRARLNVGTIRGLVPSEATGATFPALYLVRSSWLARWLARVTFGLLVVASIAFVFVPWQQTSSGSGRVVARDPQKRPQTVNSSYDGVIKSIKEGLQEGSHVVEGEIVLELEPFSADEIAGLDSQISQMESAKEAAIESVTNTENNVRRQQESGEADIRSYLNEIEAAKAKWEQKKREVVELRAEYKFKLFKLQGVRELFPKGLRSQLELSEAMSDEQAAFQKVEKAEQAEDEQFQTKQAKEEALESKRQDVEVKNNEVRNKFQSDKQKLNEIEAKISDLKIKRGQLARLKVPSPRTGIIQSLQTNIGSDTVKKGDPLFTVVPETSDLAVELTIRGNDSPLVHAGDEVRLQFQGWPAIQWVGWPSVAIGTFGGRINSINPSDDGKGDFVVFVTPDKDDPTQDAWPDNRYLRQGVRANGWVLLKTVPLGYELWRQLNGFPPIIDNPTEKGSGGGATKKDESKKPKLPK